MRAGGVLTLNSVNSCLNKGIVTMRILRLLSLFVILPGLLAAQQQNPVDHLREVLPASVADKVIAIVTDATSRGLPGQAVANRALEASAKGRSGEEVAAAAQAFATDLANAHAALQHAGRTPDASEIEAAALAKELGVDGAAISTLASTTPSGRSLAVPLTVLGALVNRGLPSDAALQAVSDRLSARASDANLVEMPGEAGRLIAEGYRPADVGRALNTGGRPSSVPANDGRPGARPNQPSQPARP
jgi:hypothetical protein